MPSTTTLPEPVAPEGYSWHERKGSGFDRINTADADALGVTAYREAWEAAAEASREAALTKHSAVLALRAVEADEYATDVAKIEARRTVAEAEQTASRVARAADAAARRYDVAYLTAPGRQAHYAAEALRLDAVAKDLGERLLDAVAERDRYLSGVGLGTHRETWTRERRYGSQTLRTEVSAAASISAPAARFDLVQRIADGEFPADVLADAEAAQRRVIAANPTTARLAAAGRTIGA